MQLIFNSVEEMQEFAKKLKGTRGGKDKDEGADTSGTTAGGAPAPMQPPQGGQQTGNGGAAFAGFAPPAGGAGPGPGFGAQGAQTGPDPEIVALVQRINTRVDAALASGQNTDAALAWFRTECGPNAVQATFDQIKSYHLFQQSKDKLLQIAKVMNA